MATHVGSRKRGEAALTYLPYAQQEHVSESLPQLGTQTAYKATFNENVYWDQMMNGILNAVEGALARLYISYPVRVTATGRDHTEMCIRNSITFHRTSPSG